LVSTGKNEVSNRLDTEIVRKLRNKMLIKVQNVLPQLINCLFSKENTDEKDLLYSQSYKIILNYLKLVMNQPLSPTEATFLAQLCNPITHQAIDLESCSNPLRILQVL